MAKRSFSDWLEEAHEQIDTSARVERLYRFIRERTKEAFEKNEPSLLPNGADIMRAMKVARHTFTYLKDALIEEGRIREFRQNRSARYASVDLEKPK